MSSPDHDAFTRTHLEQTLPAVAPYLFSLTDQLIDAHDADPFDVIVGDDTNCRLPVHFVRHALVRARGERPKTVFVNGSRIMREELPGKSYVGYLHASGGNARHVLLMSEIVGSGAAMRDLKRFAAEALPQADIETAAVASVSHVPELLDHVGGEGHEATTSVYRSFEGVARGSLQTRLLARARKMVPQAVKDRTPARYKVIGQPFQSAGVITGLYAPKGAAYPVSKPDRVHNLGAAYEAMDALLDRYVAGRTSAYEPAGMNQ